MRCRQVRRHRHRHQQTIYLALDQLYRMSPAPKVQQYHFRQLALLMTREKRNLSVGNVLLLLPHHHLQQKFHLRCRQSLKERMRRRDNPAPECQRLLYILFLCCHHLQNRLTLRHRNLRRDLAMNAIRLRHHTQLLQEFPQM
jgi:hypothetical protein